MKNAEHQHFLILHPLYYPDKVHQNIKMICSERIANLMQTIESKTQQLQFIKSFLQFEQLKRRGITI
jgi:hypothetical protein